MFDSFYGWSLPDPAGPSKNRFEFVNLQKLIEILKENAALIEKKFTELSKNEDF